MHESLTDGMELSDDPIVGNVIDRSLTDGMEFGDSALIEAIVNATPEDGITFGEQVDALFTAIAASSDGILFGSEALPYRLFVEFAEDGLIFSDLSDVNVESNTILTEGIVFGEIIVGDLGGVLVTLEAEWKEYSHQAHPVPYGFIAKDKEYSFTARIAGQGL
jgi:hypothetical protein